jgi:MurNAc alpha-1-phosphate uridylyltransferase
VSEDPALTFSGIAIYRPEFFADCQAGRFPLAPMLKNAARAGELGGSLYEGLWEDVGTPERLADLNRR